MLALQLARMTEWELGTEVGYQVRFEKKYSEMSQVIYVTDGIAQAKLLHGDSLEDFDVIILDEFHERSATIDICLGLALSLQKERKKKLRLIVTSATLNFDELKNFLPDANCLEFSGRSHPVSIDYLSVPPEIPVWVRVAQILPKILRERQGDVLIFMEGAYEISKMVKSLLACSWSEIVEVRSLFGDLTEEQQDLAIKPSSKRKIIVSTNIAETSLTIEGVRIVLDTGKAKKMRYEPSRGVNRLATESICKSSADQRAGRAGRLAPGYCLRLWSETEHEKRPEFDKPEITSIDISQIYLNLKGYRVELGELPLLETLSDDLLVEAKKNLISLGALDESGNLTSHGKKIYKLPVHPSWAHALVIAQARNHLSAIALLLSMLEERPPVEMSELAHFFPMQKVRSDPYCLLLAFEEAERKNFSLVECKKLGIHAQRCKHAAALATSLCSLLGDQFKLAVPNYEELARSLLACFPSALCVLMSEGRAVYCDANGRSLHLSNRSLIKGERFCLPLRIVEKKKSGSMAMQMEWVTGLNEEWVRAHLGEKIQNREFTSFDLSTRQVMKRTIETWKELKISEKQTFEVNATERARGFANAIFRGELNLKNWDSRVEKLLNRVEFLSEKCPDFEIKCLDDSTRLLFLEEICHSQDTWKGIKNAEIFGPLFLTWSEEQRKLINEGVPEKLNLLSSKRAYPLDYSNKGEVVIRAMLQDLYGLDKHPTIVFGRYPLVLEILAPNNRPVQRTNNVTSFWTTSYPDIRKELAGRYPKHEWR